MLYLLLSSIASAVPLQYNHQGRLLDSDGVGLVGDHELTFRILDDSDAALWEESLSVEFEDGFYSVNLGEDETNNPLDDSIFAAYPLWMELSVDGEALSPTHPIQSVPYANISGLAENLDGGTVNASDIAINGIPVIDGDGNWVGPQELEQWNDIQNRPPGLDDGDDDTQLDQAGVLGYVDGSQVNLGSGSQVDGSAIVTADSYASYLPGDLADGDSDILASLNCFMGEIVSWGPNNTWICTSDASLEWPDIETMLSGNAADLNAGTTIGGETIVTSTTDMDTLNALACQDGEIAKYDGNQGVWYCAGDDNTFLDQAGVLGYVDGSQVDLGSGSQVAGSAIVTADSYTSYLPSDLADGDADTQLDQASVLGYVQGQTLNLGVGSQVDGSAIVTADSYTSYLPSDLADGDADTQLDQAGVLGYVDGSQVNLGSGSQVAGSAIVTADSYTSYLPSDLADGDNDTQLSDSEVIDMVQNASGIDLNGELSVGGAATFNDSVTAESGLTVNGPLVTDTIEGPYGYKEFTTDRVASSSTSSKTYTLLNMRCSGHWGSYFVEIDLITWYYRPSVRRYEYYCGNGNHTSGGTLAEISNPQTVGSLVSLSKTSPVDTGYDHSNIRMYDVELQVTQGAYVHSYARVRTYGMWASYPAGSTHSNTAPGAIWPTWTE